MNNYKILQYVVGNYYKICEWTAETASKAVAEFLEMNPEYKNRPITAWKI